MDAADAERRFAAMLAEEGLPRFASAVYDAPSGELQLRWHHGLTLHLDLDRPGIEPLDDWERAAILGVLPTPSGDEPIHISVPGCGADPRAAASVPGVELHFVPPLHPDDVTVLDGMRVTSPSRTLIDLAEVMDAEELRVAFARARTLGLLDPEALRAARERVEWRPSLAMLDAVIEEFVD